MDSENWSEGQVIRGKYRVLSKLGEGSLGATYKVEHLLLKDTCALKVLSPEWARDSECVKRFKHEATLSRRILHPNVATVGGFDIAEDGLPFIERELIEGQSLRQVIQAEGRVSLPRACSIAIQIAAALDTAHTLGVIHAGLKPDNAMLIQSPCGEQVKVLDFGLTRVREAQPGIASVHRGGGTGIGTPAYLSPEQAAGNELDGRSDIYSLGIILYRMLAGRLPLRADSKAGMVIAQIETPPLPIQSTDTGIPERLASLVMSCLDKQADRRPATARALIAEIEDALVPPRPPPQRLQARPPEPEVEWPRRLAVFAVALSLTLGAIYFGTKPSSKRSTARGMKVSTPPDDTAAGQSTLNGPWLGPSEAAPMHDGQMLAANRTYTGAASTSPASPARSEPAASEENALGHSSRGNFLATERDPVPSKNSNQEVI